MENNIPTAEKWLTSFGSDADDMFYKHSVEEAMIEFAKLHCEAALKEASEKAQWICESQESWFGDTRDYDFCETDNDGDKTQIHSILINKESILNAYPLTLIK